MKKIKYLYSFMLLLVSLFGLMGAHVYANTNDAYFYTYFDDGSGQITEQQLSENFLEYHYNENVISDGGNIQDAISVPNGNNWESDARFTIRLKSSKYSIGLFDIEGGILEVLTANFFDLKYDSSPYDYNNSRSFKEIADKYHIKNFHIKPFEAHRPSISGVDTIINNIDTPYTIETIKTIAGLRAHDAYYGDLTNLIEIKLDNYSPNKNKVGTFQITFSVKNPIGLTSSTILNIFNVDRVAPKITGSSSSSISYKTEMTHEQMIALYKVEDNYSKDIKLQVVTSNYVAGQVGEFTYTLSAKDSSGNTSQVVHTLTVFDDINPVIVDKQVGHITLDWKQIYTEKELLLDLSANDEVDGDLTKNIKIIKSNFKSGVVGNYEVTYAVFDKAGNSTEHQRFYVIETKDVPIFYVSKNTLMIEDVNQMTVEQIILEMAKYEGLSVSSYTVMVDEYTGNETLPGTYQVSASLSLTTGETVEINRVVKVFTLNDDYNEDFANPITNHYLPWLMTGLTVLITITLSVIIILKKKRKI